MAAFTAQCGSCGKKFKIGDSDKIGKKTKCKSCGEVMVLKPVKSADKDDLVSLQAAAPRGRSSMRNAPLPNYVDPEEREKLLRGDRPERLGTPSSDRIKMLISVGGAFGLVIFIVLFVFASAAVIPMIMMAEVVEPPTEYEMFSVDKFPFRVQKPKSFQRTYTGGSPAPAYALFEKGSVRIEFHEENPALRAEPQPSQIDRPDLDTVADVHAMRAKFMRENFPKFDESPSERFEGSTQKHFSTFTYNKLFVGKMKGLRFTILNARFQLYVTCSCPEKDFEEFEESFKHILGSIVPRR